MLILLVALLIGLFRIVDGAKSMQLKRDTLVRKVRFKLFSVSAIFITFEVSNFSLN